MSKVRDNFPAFVDEEIITESPDRMSGAPCFTGTRVPVKNLFDYLSGEQSIDEFLEDFPGVERRQIIRLLEQIGDGFNPHGNV